MTHCFVHPGYFEQFKIFGIIFVMHVTMSCSNTCWLITERGRLYFMKWPSAYCVLAVSMRLGLVRGCLYLGRTQHQQSFQHVW